MTSLVNALDNISSTCIGENGHVEYDWSHNISEKIVQFDFQCLRTDEAGVNALASILDQLLIDLSFIQIDETKEQSRRASLVNLYKIIGKTRDIEGGKGE